MPRRLAWLTLFALAGCASTGATVEDMPPPVADTHSPNLIPAECEALLAKTQEWAYQPGQPWKPNSAIQAMDATRFFARFRLISDAGSEFYRAFLAAGVPTSDAESLAMQQAMSKVQVCDSLLAQQFLESLARYPWPKADRKEAGHNLYQFVLNQQAMVLPLIPRIVQLHVYQRAIAAGLLTGPGKQVKALLAEADRERKKFPPGDEKDAGGSLRRMQQELELSNRLRDRLSRLLPLP